MDKEPEYIFTTSITGIAKYIIGVLQLTRRAELWVHLAAKCLPPMHTVEWLAQELTLKSSKTISSYILTYT